MIGRLSGKLVEIEETSLLVDVAGVAYEVEVSASVIAQLPMLGEPLTLHTHFVVREDAQLLYGFVSKREREMFRVFIKISGVGPKLGLALISSLDARALWRAVHEHDVSILTKVPGVGKKTAERLLLEMKSKLEDLGDPGGAPLSVIGGAEAPSGMAAEAEGALVALGYRPAEAGRAVSEAMAELGGAGEDASTQQLVRLALRRFARSAS